MFYNQTIKLENESVKISNDRYFHLNHRIAFLAIYLVFVGYGIFYLLKWDSLREFEIFLSTAMLTTGVIGFIREIFFKSYRKTIPLNEIRTIKMQKTILNLNRPKVRIRLKNGKSQDVYTDSQHANLLLELIDE